MRKQTKNFQGKTQIGSNLRVVPEVKERLDSISRIKNQSLNKTTADLIDQALLQLELCKVLDNELEPSETQ